MSDYTPTTEDLRAAYENRAVIGPPAMAANYEEARAQFDRWLAREKAAAVRAIADGLGPDVTRGAPIHPGIIRDALYIRADRIERGEL